METTRINSRTRNTVDDGFAQDSHGQKDPGGGQTPAGMFLEWFCSFERDRGMYPSKCGGARVSVIGRTAKGKLFNKANLETREDVLGWVISCVDGHLTAFDHDDYSARLIVLDRGSRLAWLEMLNPDADADSHPEMGRWGRQE